MLQLAAPAVAGATGCQDEQPTPPWRAATCSTVLPASSPARRRRLRRSQPPRRAESENAGRGHVDGVLDRCAKEPGERILECARAHEALPRVGVERALVDADEFVGKIRPDVA